MWTIYTREACGYCDMAKAELKRLGIKELSEKLNKPRYTYPQIFTEEGKSVGGFDNLLDYTEHMD
jgi:glutaredoxin